MRVIVAILWVALIGATDVTARSALADVVSARYDAPTTRYDHSILGDAVEWGSLVMNIANGQTVTITLPQTHVFEDVAPRIIDINADGVSEVMVVETAMTQGARLAIYDGLGDLMAATPYIGQTHRWLAPIGAADLDGDGHVEVAYIDRPHLAKKLRVWRFIAGELVPVADLAGLTNHRIGEADIGGGMRICASDIAMITASADWANVMATRLDKDMLTTSVVGPHTGRASLSAAMMCP